MGKPTEKQLRALRNMAQGWKLKANMKPHTFDDASDEMERLMCEIRHIKNNEHYRLYNKVSSILNRQ